MTSVVAGIPGVAVYMDDIVVHGPHRETHDERLDQVFQRLARRNLTVNTEKCLFGVAEIPFVGHRVSGKGIAPLSSNIEAILRLPPPQSVSDLSTFLGMTNYYLRFVEDYSRITESLRHLLRKEVPWVWSAECQSAFQRLKEKITSAPILAHFSSEASTFITCDASGSAIGAVLSQEQGGVERPVSFASNALSPAEQKYSVGEREALACVWACEKWHLFPYVRQFRLRTDHQALVALFSATGTGHRTLRLHRWTERLCRYSFKMEYRPGHCNQVADLLSRFRAPVEEEILEPLEDEECVLMLGHGVQE